jgi:hypothetical protein
MNDEYKIKLGNEFLDIAEREKLSADNALELLYFIETHVLMAKGIIEQQGNQS